MASAPDQPMRRVLVVGSAGAGKTTLSTRLAAKLGLSVVFLDVHYWQPGWKAMGAAAWRQRVDGLADGPEWVMDGNFSETFDIRMRRADSLVWLDYPRVACMRRVLVRAIRDHGRQRRDLPEGCPEQFDAKLLRWVWDFPRRQRPQIVDAIERYGRHLHVTRIENDRAAAKFLAMAGAA